MTIHEYIENISLRYASGITTEHSFRGDLQQLLESLVPEIRATNEPKRIECGAPDYVITRKDIPVGYIEAKDVGVDLDGKNLKEQFDRYRDALDNLVFTDYLDFRFYLNGELTTSVKIAGTQNGRIVSLPENFEQFTSLIKQFCSRTPQTIKSSKKLAEMMAEKAKILAFIIKNALDEDVQSEENSTLREQMKAFKDILIHDIDAKAFADIYAQTIAYGMFAARLHDKNLDTFSRREAAELIPKTNPFLRKLFQYIAGFDLDTRIDWIVDALADLFRATDIAAILKNFGKSTQTHDPIMHFYETFLAEYDPKLRKSRGVFYTPEPVVDFIVRAVDDILKSEFNLPNGIADTSKTKIKVYVQGKIQEKEVHKVQILDPATGTGTFLASVIKQIYKGFEGQQGIWNQYVDEHLIPRLNGFELLMASYAMAHLKLDLLLTELRAEPPALAGGTVQKPVREQGRNTQLGGYALADARASVNQRFQIYLTNALEEYHPDTGTLFASWLSTEANEANHIKRDTPVMVVIGNPPYSLSSSNKSKWIEEKVAEYKVDLDEQNLNALSDDYVKFIRYAQWLIQKNGSGIVAIISNNSFIDGITQRKMRENLFNTFDKIYIYDLHGSMKRKEKAPDGSKDENVFDIQQGVSISIFVKNETENAREKTILHYDSFGLREVKYKRLLTSDLDSIEWTEVQPHEPYFFFVPKDASGLEGYNAGFSPNDLFIKSGNGIKFRKDNLLVKNMFANEDVKTMLREINHLSSEQIYAKYDFEPTPDWRLEDKKRFFIENDFANIIKVDYRQFDPRFAYYPLNSINEIIVRGDSRRNLMKNYFLGDNHGLIIGRQGQVVGDMPWNLVFISKNPTDMNIFYRGGGINFPLYLYPDDNSQQTLDGRTERVPNLNSEIVEKIAAGIGLTFLSEPGALATGLRSDDTEKRPVITIPGSDKTTPPAHAGGSAFYPIDILDYIYAVLHSPGYRENYKEFLKIDFPRVPYPKDAVTFWELVALGGELRQIHLLESPVLNRFITSFNVGGDNIVEKIAFRTGAQASRLQTPETAFVPPASANPTVTASESEADPPRASEALALQTGSVYFNATQYFEGVPETAWNFYIGGYQPAQKWLKDRKGRQLNFDDIQHYQKIIVALAETGRLMKEIDRFELTD
jgi:predicted helicase